MKDATIILKSLTDHGGYLRLLVLLAAFFVFVEDRFVLLAGLTVFVGALAAVGARRAKPPATAMKGSEKSIFNSTHSGQWSDI